MSEASACSVRASMTGRTPAAVLCGLRDYQPAPTVLPVPTLLPAAERRRTGRVVRLALAVAQEATTRAGVEPAELASVFSSSGGGRPQLPRNLPGTGAGRRASCRRHDSRIPSTTPPLDTGALQRAPSANRTCCAPSMQASAPACWKRWRTWWWRSSRCFSSPTIRTIPSRCVPSGPIPDAFGAAFVLTPHRERGSLARIEASLAEQPADALTDPRLEALRAVDPRRALPAVAAAAGDAAAGAHGSRVPRRIEYHRAGRTMQLESRLDRSAHPAQRPHVPAR